MQSDKPLFSLLGAVAILTNYGAPHD